MNYYNDNDHFCVETIKGLISQKIIPDGFVDNRSIADVVPNELENYTQCHFFTGVAGWPYALRMLGWPDEQPCWTGSCPCQPFSNAGKGEGFNDARNFWPAFRWLIAQCRPSVIFGEQVATELAIEWITRLHLDLEVLGYTVSVADLPAASVGAHHIRQRLWWVAYTESMFSNGSGFYKDGYNELMEKISKFGNCNPTKIWDGLRWPVPQGKVCTFPDWTSSARIDLLRCAGNAIVPQVAAEFIRAFLETQAPEAGRGT